MYKVKTASVSVEWEVHTSYLQVMWPTPDNRNAIMPESPTILNAVEITINSDQAHASIVPCSITCDLIFANFVS